MKEEHESECKSIKSNIYGMLVCGIILIAVGIYMNLNDISSTAHLSRRSAGRLNGTASIVIGCMIAVFPVWKIVAHYVKTNKKR